MTTQAVSPEYLVVGPVPSGATFAYSGVLTQLDGVTPMAANMLQTLTLTFVDVDTRAVINGRDNQNVFNQGNGVTVDNTLGTGALQWVGGAADNPFVRTDPPPQRGDVERHEAVFSWTWQQGGVTYPGSKKVFVIVENYQNTDKTEQGTGSSVYSDFVFEPDGLTPADDAIVWITSDAGGATLVAGPQKTTPAGQFTFNLDPGAYFLWVDSPDFERSGPNSVTVT